MKRLFYIGFLCFFGLHVFAQNYSIETNKMDAFVADYAEEIIKTNTPSDSRHYAYTLTQNNMELVVTCNVMPDNINVTEQTNDLWNEIENTIIRAINKTKKTLSSPQTQSTTFTNTIPSLSSNPKTVTTYDNSPKAPEQSVVRQSDQNNNNSYNNHQKLPNDNIDHNQLQYYTIDDVRSGKATIGGRICFSDGSCGIIFFLDKTGHGLAVSLDEVETKWQNARIDRHCQDIYQLANEGNPTQQFNSGLGFYQTQMIINQLGRGQAPAAEWCLEHGEDWYLPSAGELWYLFTEANYKINDGKKGSSDAKNGFISKMLKTSGGKPLESNWYWSSSEKEQENAWNVSVSGQYSTEGKTTEVTVRAIRHF